MNPILTIGMPHFNDFAGVWATIQALRLYHNLDDVEILVVDNSGSKKLEDWIKGWTKARYVLCNAVEGTAYAKNKVFEHAAGRFVLCIDCHVFLGVGVVDRLKRFINSGSSLTDLYYGRMTYDSLDIHVVSMENVWRGHMWGVWGPNIKTKDLPTEPQEIWGHGGGCFGAFKKGWLGFNSEFRGFGGEEGYLPEKYRVYGNKVIGLPWLQWLHRFTDGTGYKLSVKDRVRNSLIGFRELGLDTKPIHDHFGSIAKYEERKLEDEQGASRTRTAGNAKVCAAG